MKGESDSITRDNITYRLLKQRAGGVNTYQELNPDGSDFIEYNRNSSGDIVSVKDNGRRLIQTENTKGNTEKKFNH